MKQPVIRSLSGLMLIVVSVWMFQVVLWGAYKKPREVQWWVVLGVLGLLTLAI